MGVAEGRRRSRAALARRLRNRSASRRSISLLAGIETVQLVAKHLPRTSRRLDSSYTRLTQVDASGRAVGEPLRVVGVVDNTIGADLNERPPPRIFRPLATRSLETVAFVVRGAGDGVQVAAGVRGALRAADRDLAVAEVRQLSEAIDALLREYYEILVLFTGARRIR